MIEYEFATDLVKYAPTVHAPTELLKARIDRLSKVRENFDLNQIVKKLVSNAIITTSIDLGDAFEAEKSPEL